MEDRIPTAGQEGRVLITPENGSAPFYATVTMADNPTNPGTPLNKATLLQDSTEVELFGNSANRTVDEAFSGIAGKISLIMSDSAKINITVLDQNSNPVQGVYVNGILNDKGQTVITNAEGKATGLISEGSVTVSISGYADIVNFSKKLQIIKGQEYNESFTVTTRNFLKVTATKSVRFSGNVTSVDYQCQGGGGGGTGSDISGGYAKTGSGGAGGDASDVETLTPTPNIQYSVVIGAGGNGGLSNSGVDKAGNGGDTVFNGTTAKGGQGSYWRNGETVPGTSASSTGGQGLNKFNNGESFPGNPGGSSVKQIFSSFTETLPAAGAGGGGAVNNGSTSAPGGATGGGNGGSGAFGTAGVAQKGFPGKAGTGGGGGGAGTRYVNGSTYSGAGGKGGSGCVVMRMSLVHQLS